MAHSHVSLFSSKNGVIDMDSAITLNNDAVRLTKEGDFAAAERAAHESVRLKALSFGEDSIHTCISLSGLADCYYYWAVRGGDRSKLPLARATAERMLRAAERVGDANQLRIVREILSDVSKAEAEGAARAGGAGRAATGGAGAGAAAAAGAAGAPVASTCANPACPGVAAGAPMAKCSRCHGVRYCGASCQHAHWREHKPACRAPDASK